MSALDVVKERKLGEPATDDRFDQFCLAWAPFTDRKPFVTDRSEDKQAKRHQEDLTPRCSKCGSATKPTMIVPGRNEKIVWYRCEECQTEFRRTVPR